MRTRLAILAVAVLTLTAGCAGLLPGDGGEETGPAEINESTIDTHQSELEAANNFTVRAEVTGGDGTTEYRARIDAKHQRALVTTANDQVVEEYLNESTRHARAMGPDGERLFRVSEREFTVSTLLMPTLYPVDAEYERTNTTTIGGTEVGVYEATGLGNDGTTLNGEVTDFEGQNFTATLYVTDDGLIKRAEWSATVRGQEVEAMLTVESIGDTSVSRPQWADRAVASEADDGENDTPSSAPMVRFNVSYNANEERATLTHAGGDELASGNVSVVVETNGTTEKRAVTVNGSTIAQGDEFTVEGVSPGSTVRVVWSYGDLTETIYKYEAPTVQKQADP